MSSVAAQKIITHGLDCGSAKPGLIQAHFGLFCFGVFPDRDEGAGGGPYPYTAWNRLEPGEIANFFKEVEVNGELIVPLDQEAEYFRKKHIVILKVNFGKLEFEKAARLRDEIAELRDMPEIDGETNRPREAVSGIVKKRKKKGKW